MIALVIGAACYSTPDYGSAHLKCDAEHGCPPGQACVNSRCDPAGAPAVSVACGAVACGAGQACCADVNGSATCVAAGTFCQGASATCDGVEDCGGRACCLASLGATISCGNDVCDEQICRDPADCLLPSAPICCFETGLPSEPWGHCGPSCP